MINIKFLAAIAILGVIFLFGSSIYSNFDSWLQTQFNGPEYCFKNIDQTSVSVAAQGVEVKYTKIEGNILCFRTKDSSIPERINQQIQDRKMQERLAEIEANRQFWNETFPKLFIFGLIALVVIFVIIYLSSGRDYYSL